MKKNKLSELENQTCLDYWFVIAAAVAAYYLITQASWIW